jgi:hypothetical protein
VALMTVHALLLILALLLLWLPRPWLRRGPTFFRRRRRMAEPWNIRETGDPRVSFRVEFGKFRNYVDFLRAGIGSRIVMGAAGLPAAIPSEPDPPRSAVVSAMALQAAILLGGVVIQTVRREKKRISFYPPIFYLAGVSIGLCDVRAAVFAFALTWTINAGLPNARGFLLVYALLIVAFGRLFAGWSDLAVAFSGFLAFLPVLLSLLSKRPLAMLARKEKRTAIRS